jgi:hypothetical protein
MPMYEIGVQGAAWQTVPPIVRPWSIPQQTSPVEQSEALMHLTAIGESPAASPPEDAPEEDDAPLELPPSSPAALLDDELQPVPDATAKPTLRKATKKIFELCMETFLLSGDDGRGSLARAPAMARLTLVARAFGT